VPALPAPSFAGLSPGDAPDPDPIFAAIAAHARAYAAFDAVLDDLAVAERAAWHAPRGGRRAARKRLAEAYAAERRFGQMETDAVARLVATVPQTLPGAAAGLAYVRGHFAHGYPLCDDDGLMALLGGTEEVIRRAAGLPSPVP
jgi:hypothetical protein